MKNARMKILKVEGFFSMNYGPSFGGWGGGQQDEGLGSLAGGTGGVLESLFSKEGVSCGSCG